MRAVRSLRCCAGAGAVASHDKVKHPTVNPPRPLSAKLASCAVSGQPPAQQPGLGWGTAMLGSMHGVDSRPGAGKNVLVLVDRTSFN